MQTNLKEHKNNNHNVNHSNPSIPQTSSHVLNDLQAPFIPNEDVTMSEAMETINGEAYQWKRYKEL